jgi:hypothetical protein
MGYRPMMTRERNETTKRAGSALLVLLMVIGSTGRQPAAKACHMSGMGRVPDSSCGSCKPASTPDTKPLLSAGSCCRFEAPRDLPSTPTVTVSPVRVTPLSGATTLVLPHSVIAGKAAPETVLLSLAAYAPPAPAGTSSILRL